MSSSHVSYEDLIAYAAGDLAPEDAARVESAIAADPAAQHTVETFRQVATTVAEDDSVEPAPSVIERAKALFDVEKRSAMRDWLDAVDRFVATLIYDSRAQPATAGYRGTAEAVRLSFESEDFAADVDLEITPQPDGGEEQHQVRGQVSAERAVASAEVRLLAAGTTQSVDHAVADENGMFMLQAPEGTYDLAIRLGDEALVLPGIAIG